MNKFLIESQADLRILIVNTSERTGISEAVIEKDYWVSFVLDYLFHHNKWKDAFTFKGGTALAKCFGLIERFSEDIDLILDWRILGYGAFEPWEERSNTRQDKLNKEVNVKTEEFLIHEFLPEIDKDFKKLLTSDFEFSINQDNLLHVQFMYPRIFTSPYLTQNIKLEIGSLAAWTPAQEVGVEPIIADTYPEVFKEKSMHILKCFMNYLWNKYNAIHDFE